MHQSPHDFHEQIPGSEQADDALADVFNPYGSGPVPIGPKQEESEASHDPA